MAEKIDDARELDRLRDKVLSIYRMQERWPIMAKEELADLARQIAHHRAFYSND